MSNWNDGGVPDGGRLIKLYSPSGVDASGNTQWPTDKGIWVMESFSPTRSQRVARRYNASGNPNGALGIDDFSEGSAVIQPEFASTDMPDAGWAFTSKRRGTNGANNSWVITSVEEPEAAGEIRKVSIRVQKIVTATGPSVYPAA